MFEDRKEDNLSERIAEEFALANQSFKSPEREILDTVAEYSLQFNSEQLEVLHNLYLKIILNDLVPETAKQKTLLFIDFVKKNKRYHDTLMFVMNTVEAMHYKSIVEGGGGVSTQIVKTSR